MDGHDEASGPGIGELARDTAKNKVGVLMGSVGGRYLLRPLNGGCEWEVEPGAMGRLTASEALTERTRIENERSRVAGALKAGQ
ncbi:hypothetical protein ACGFYA_20360 [Streptomyces sp. NPDC048305]|uniref:hypothetical protein n=1 Tax=Streptomyces sp. NPDC048305 TaxID=3365532 RepID=UPI003719D545